MSRHEASWHTHLAGMRAAEAARAQGGNPHAIEAFATATAGPVILHGFTLYPATEGMVWTLKRMAREFNTWADRLGMPRAEFGEEDGTRELLELGLSTLVFCDALATWQALEMGQLESLIVKAEALMWQAPVAVAMDLAAHFKKQMRVIRDLTPGEEDAPGKPPETAGNGISPGMPTPPPVPASPLLNGWRPNTGSLSPMPSGEPPSSLPSSSSQSETSALAAAAARTT
jgi:hypothetical protein